MKTTKALIAFGLALSVARWAGATCTGGGDPCNAPRNGSITGHSATTISLQVQNSATPNVTNSIFFFQATTLGSAQNVGTPDRNTVIVFTANFTNPATSGDIIAQTVKPLLASANYNTFAKACPPGSTQPTDAGCSAWVSIGAQATNALTNAGFNNIASADTEPQQFIARTNGSVVDQTNVIAWLTTQLASTEVGNCVLSKNLQPFPGSGTTSLTITSADCNTLLPNRPYTLTEHLVYDPTQSAPNYVTSTFYSRAKDPVAIDPVASVTHCSAVLNFQNAASNPANPSDTVYSINVGGPVSTGSATQTRTIGGTGVFSDQNSVTFTNLQAGTNYTPSVTALNRGSGWRNSNADAYTAFQTVSWNGSFSVTGITTNSATFNVLSLNSVGITSWVIVLNGSTTGTPSGSGAPPSTIALTGLTPNRSNTVQIRLTEASGCFSQLPTTAITFVTDAADPTSFQLNATSNPRQLSASWADALNNTGTTYQVKYCTNLAMTTGCNTTSAISGLSTTLSTGIVPETTYFAQVKALGISGGQDSNFIPTTPDSATTPNEAPTVPAPSCSVSGTTANCSVAASDNGGASHLKYHWVVTPAAVSIVPNDVVNNNATVVTFSGNGIYTVSVTVTDHDGVGGLSGTNQTTVNVGAVANSITITPNSATLATGNNQLFTAHVFDQFGVEIPNASVNWSFSSGNGAAGTFSASGHTTTFNATNPGTGTLTASLSGATSGTAALTINAAGAFFVNSPTITLNPDNKTANVSALGGDNVSGESSIRYTWTVESGPGVISVNPNGTNAAKNAVVTFTKAGTYVLRCTLSNSNGSTSATTPAVTRAQVLSAITVTPNDVTIRVQELKKFEAAGLDQFGDAMNPPNVQWSSTGGNISGAGVFSSPSLGSRLTVVARSGNLTGQATINVIDFNVSNAYAYPVPYKSTQGNTITFTGLGSSAKIRIYTSTGRLVFNTEVTSSTFPWQVINNNGERLASGVYFYVIESPESKKDGKLIIIQ